MHREGSFYDVVPVAQLPHLPKVSVLVRSTGRPDLMEKTLRTVANQVYPNIETVLVEDGPATLHAVVDAFADLEIVYVPMGRPAGRCAAGNEALRRATGEYCIFLDEGDGFYADHLEQLIGAVLSDKCKVSYSWAFEVPTQYREDGESILREGPHRTTLKREFSHLELFHHNFLPLVSVLFHRSLFEACGGFDPELSGLEDWNLWVRFSIKSGPFKLVPKTTAFYRIPLRATDVLKEQAELDQQLEAASAKHAKLTFTASVPDLVREYERLFANPAARTDVVARVLNRFPVLRRPAAAMFNALGRLAAG
jgi:glycosyltransferase involved in cell wall biosynthesis